MQPGMDVMQPWCHKTCCSIAAMPGSSCVWINWCLQQVMMHCICRLDCLYFCYGLLFHNGAQTNFSPLVDNNSNLSSRSSNMALANSLRLVANPANRNLEFCRAAQSTLIEWPANLKFCYSVTVRFGCKITRTFSYLITFYVKSRRLLQSCIALPHSTCKCHQHQHRNCYEYVSPL